MRPPEKLRHSMFDTQRLALFQFLQSFLCRLSGWFANQRLDRS